MNKIDDIFKSSNLLYHYTRIQTAYDHILYTNKLKLSERHTSNDPIENIIDPIITNSFYGYNETERPSDKDISEASNFIKEKIKNAKQICFCMNSDNPDFHKFTILPYEYFGFLKPRMWDQYGDKYNGVCLVFDKTKLETNKSDIYSKKVEYISYSEFHRNHANIDLNDLQDYGLDQYYETSFERIKNQGFLKHLDYSGENEYRFITFLEKDTYINIGDSLKAIVISDRSLSDFARNWFIKYANENNVKLFFISWTNTGFIMKSKSQYEKSLESAKQLISQFKKG